MLECLCTTAAAAFRHSAFASFLYFFFLAPAGHNGVGYAIRANRVVVATFDECGNTGVAPYEHLSEGQGYVEGSRVTAGKVIAAMIVVTTV